MPTTAPRPAVSRPAARFTEARPATRRDPRADDLSPAMRRAKELAGDRVRDEAPAVKRHVTVPRLASRARLTSLPRPSAEERTAEERKVDFIALTAVRIGATAAEVAAGRAAGEAMRAKLAALRAAKAAPPAVRVAPLRPARPVRPAARTAAAA